MSSGLLPAWEELSHERMPGDGWLTRRILTDACCPIRAALRAPDGTPALLLEVSAESVRDVVEYPAATGFSVTPESIIPGPHGSIRLCLVLTDIRYREQFNPLCEDVLTAIGDAADERQAVRRYLARLLAWQTFLQRHREGLTLEEQTGLFAEISFLLDVCQPLLGEAALAAWKGPRGGLRDFLVGATGIEVKATVSAGGPVQVSNLAQFDETTLELLLLCRYTIAQSDRGTFLPELVERARTAFAGYGRASMEEIEALLISAGYSQMHAPRYQGRRLQVVSTRYFRVINDFPRLTAGRVPRGIVDVSYSVDLAACLPYEITDSTALALIARRPL